MSRKNARPEFWLYIDTYVLLSVKRDWVLLYNPLNGKAAEYRGVPEIGALARRLKHPGNMYVARLTEEDLQNPVYRGFIRDIRLSFMGDVIPAGASLGKPVQMTPQVTIEKDVRRLKNRDLRSVGQDIMRYLSELTLYITNECGAGCSECGESWRQFSCCMAHGPGKQPSELDIRDIDDVFNQVGGSRLVNINILGGDLFRYYALEELFERLHLLPMHKTLYIHYKNIRQPRWNLLKALMQANRNTLLKIPVTFPVDEAKLEEAIRDLQSSELMHMARFMFIISDEEQFVQSEALIERLEIMGVSFHPFYDGNNLIFFAANIFTKREDIIDARPAWNHIHARWAVNNLSFGRLYILSDGSLHAGVNAPRLGKLGKMSIFDALVKEMEQGRSWRRIRRKVSPCRQCVFELLCPSLSDYSYSLKRNNLCTVWLPEYDGEKGGEAAENGENNS